MSRRLTAGEPLVPHSPQDSARGSGPGGGGEPPGRPPPPPQPPAKQPSPKPPRKRGGGFSRLVRSAVAVVVALFFVVGGGGAVVALHTYNRIAADLPSVDVLRTYQPPEMSRVYAGNDRLIAELATERRIFVPINAIPDVVKQAFVSAEDKTFWVHNGVDPVAILRAGVTDLMQMGHGRRPIGASTITQQVAKNMLLGSNAVSLTRKIKEAILARRIEQTLSKDRILELYLNDIYLGLGAYGVAAASQTYFNKRLDDLTLAEAAFLAALPKAPNNYNPFRYPDAARARRDWVLDRMAEDGAVTQDQVRQAKAEPIVPKAFRKPEMVQGAEWFAEEVRRQLIDKFGAQMALQGGLAVRTSLDPRLQEAADKALRDGLMAYDRKHGNWRGPVTHLQSSPALLKVEWASELAQVARPPGMLPDWRLAVVLETGGSEAKLGWLEPAAAAGAPPSPRISPIYLSDMLWARHNGAGPRRIADVMRVGDVVMTELVPGQAAQGRGPARPDRLVLRQIPQVQGALVSLDPQTGRVLAMSGGWSPETSQFNRVTQAARQPGSSFKPMVYLTAMERDISPSQSFLDAPFVQDMGAQGQWRPHDYEDSTLGEVPLHVALEKSLNLVTVRLAQHIGMKSVAQTAIAFHVVDSMPLVLPAALGAVETTVMRQAGAYASLAMEGREVIPSVVDSVQDSQGRVVWRNPVLSCACSDPDTPPSLADRRRPIADPQSVFQVIKMMEGVVQHGTGYEAGKGLNRPIAGKTGTTQDFKDAWFVGFTPDLVTAVWIGFDDPQPLGKNETGGVVSAPVWNAFMKVALDGRPKLDFPVPEGVTVQSWDSGWGRVTDAFKPGQAPGASTTMAGADQANPAPSDSGATMAGYRSTLDTQMGGLY